MKRNLPLEKSTQQWLKILGGFEQTKEVDGSHSFIGTENRGNAPVAWVMQAQDWAELAIAAQEVADYLNKLNGQENN